MSRKIAGRIRRKLRIRKKVIGAAEKPRLSVFKSHRNLFLQLVDDDTGKTVLGLGTDAPEFVKQYSGPGNVKQASLFGVFFAACAKEKGVSKIVFDRSGYQYHGRVKALAEALRKNGLVF